MYREIKELTFLGWHNWGMQRAIRRILRRALVILVTLLIVYAAIIPLVIHHSPWIQRSVAFARKCIWIICIWEFISMSPLLQLELLQLIVQRGWTTLGQRHWASMTQSTSTWILKTEQISESGTWDEHPLNVKFELILCEINCVSTLP